MIWAGEITFKSIEKILSYNGIILINKLIHPNIYMYWFFIALPQMSSKTTREWDHRVEVRELSPSIGEEIRSICFIIFWRKVENRKFACLHFWVLHLSGLYELKVAIHCHQSFPDEIRWSGIIKSSPDN